MGRLPFVLTLFKLTSSDLSLLLSSFEILYYNLSWRNSDEVRLLSHLSLS